MKKFLVYLTAEERRRLLLLVEQGKKPEKARKQILSERK
jgi:hypothetical protein